MRFAVNCASGFHQHVRQNLSSTGTVRFPHKTVIRLSGFSLIICRKVSPIAKQVISGDQSSPDISPSCQQDSNLSAAAGQTYQTQISDRSFPKSGRAGDQEKSGTDSREDSGTREATEEFIAINFTVSELKLKDAPTPKHVREIERLRNRGMGR